jgi:hypothetical protein
LQISLRKILNLLDIPQDYNNTGLLGTIFDYI